MPTKLSLITMCVQGLPDAKFAKAGKTVSVKYTGRLKSNGKVFDATKGNKAFNFRLGVGEVRRRSGQGYGQGLNMLGGGIVRSTVGADSARGVHHSSGDMICPPLLPATTQQV